MITDESRSNLVRETNELMRSGVAWKDRVNCMDSSHPREDKDRYMDMIQGLFKHVLYEDRHQNRVTQPGSLEPCRGQGTDKLVIFRLKAGSIVSHEFYIGKEVMVRPEEISYAPIKGKLVRSSGHELVISVRNLADTSIESQLNFKFIPGMIEPIERDSLERQMEVICNQKSSYFQNEEIAQYLLHDPLIRGRVIIEANESVLPYDPEDILNAIQREVVTWATQLTGISLLAGPPGTGKTQTAAELIYALCKVRHKDPILVVSSSNTAVDVLCRRVIQWKAERDPDGTMICGRLCSKSHGQLFRYSDVGEYDVASIVIRAHKRIPAEDRAIGQEVLECEDLEEFFNLMDSDAATKRWFHTQLKHELKQCNVIFTTNSLAGSQAMTDIKPRYVIMDESGATPEYETFVVAARNGPNVPMLLVGDFMQLPPVIKSQKVKRCIGVSVMERLWRNTVVPRRQLVFQYRFDPLFESFLNTFIYNEQSGMLPIATDPHRSLNIQRPGFSVNVPVVVIDSSSTTQQGGEAHEVHSGYENVVEAQLVVDVVRRLVESSRMINSVSPVSIGVCTPYRRQAALIKYKLQKITKSGGFKYTSITVSTADSFQGSERDYMIVSTVRTSTNKVEFALSQQRLNVMLTRGKVLTVVVSNKAMLRVKACVLLLRMQICLQTHVKVEKLFKDCLSGPRITKSCIRF